MVITGGDTWGRRQPEKRAASAGVTEIKGDLCREIIAEKPKIYKLIYFMKSVCKCPFGEEFKCSNATLKNTKMKHFPSKIQLLRFRYFPI